MKPYISLSAHLGMNFVDFFEANAEPGSDGWLLVAGFVSVCEATLDASRLAVRGRAAACAG